MHGEHEVPSCAMSILDFAETNLELKPELKGIHTLAVIAHFPFLSRKVTIHSRLERYILGLGS